MQAAKQGVHGCTVRVMMVAGVGNFVVVVVAVAVAVVVEGAVAKDCFRHSRSLRFRHLKHWMVVDIADLILDVGVGVMQVFGRCWVAGGFRHYIGQCSGMVVMAVGIGPERRRMMVAVVRKLGRTTAVALIDRYHRNVTAVVRTRLMEPCFLCSSSRCRWEHWIGC